MGTTQKLFQGIKNFFGRKHNLPEKPKSHVVYISTPAPVIKKRKTNTTKAKKKSTKKSVSTGSNIIKAARSGNRTHLVEGKFKSNLKSNKT